MNDKPGGAQSGNNSPSNFGARPAPSAPPMKPLSGGPAAMGQQPGSLSGVYGASGSMGSTGSTGASGMPTGSSMGMSVSSFAETLRRENNARNGVGATSNMNGAAGNFGGVSGNTNGMNGLGDMNGGATNVGGMSGSGANMMNGNMSGANAGAGSPNPARAVEPEGLSRPMTKAAPVAPVAQKKSKKGLIIGLQSGAGVLVLVIALAVVAVMMLNKPDPVADAMDKLMANGLPPYVHAELSATAQLTDQTQLVSHYKLTGTADVMTSNMTNAMDATVVLGGSELDDTTFTVNEIYAGEKDLYFRFDGIYNTMDRIDMADYYANGGDEEEQELLCEDEDGEEVVCSEEMLEGEGSDEGATVDDETATDSTATDVDEKKVAGNSASGSNANGDSASGNGATTKDKAQTENKVKMKNPFTPEMMQKMLALSEVIDGDWVQVPPEEAEEAESEAAGTTGTDGEVVEEGTEADGTGKTTDATEEEGIVVEDYTDYLVQALENIGGRASICSADLFATLKNNASAVSTYYRNHPFISGTQENVTLASASYPVYRVVIDAENYGAFVDEVQNQGLLGNYLKCAGETVTNVKNYPLLLPPIYVEVDSNDNFSRIYVATNTGTANVVLDLSLNYPATINVQKPQEYVTLQQVSDEVLSLENEELVEE